MPWSDLFADADPDLADGASDPAVRAIERSLGCVFPSDYRTFLQECDGGALDDGRVVFYSVTKHEPPGGGDDESVAEDETLRRANLSQPADAPLVLIGFEEDADFGFRRTDVAQARAAAGIYLMADDGELAYAAPSFTAFARDLSRRVVKARERRAMPWWRRLFARD
jgi:hypothetical protein